MSESKIIASKKVDIGDIYITAGVAVTTVILKLDKPVTKEEAWGYIHRWDSQPDLLEACEIADKALNICLRYLLGTGPQPNPEELSKAPIKLKAALSKAQQSKQSRVERLNG